MPQQTGKPRKSWVLAGAALVAGWSPASAQRAASAENTSPPKGGVTPNAICQGCGGGGGDLPGGTGSKNDPVSIPPAHHATSPGGVDMRTGTYVVDDIDLAIGGSQSEGGIELRRAMARNLIGSQRHRERMGSFSHNWDNFLSVTRLKVIGAYSPGDFDVLVSENIGGLGTAFRSPANPVSFQQVSLEGFAQIAYTGSPSDYTNGAAFTITKSDGTTVVYRSTGNYDCQYSLACAYPESISVGDGVRFDLEYDNAAGAGSIYNKDMTRLRSIVSNKGYGMVFEYGSSTSLLVSKVCALNITNTSKSANYVCPVGAPAVSYSYSGEFMTSFTGVTGSVHTFVKSGSGSDYSVASYEPGANSPFVTNYFHVDSHNYRTVTSQTFADGRTYAYTWDRYPTMNPGNANDPLVVAGGSYTDGSGQTVTVHYGHYNDENPNESTVHLTPGPEWIRDELNRTTSADYCYWTTNPTTAISSCHVTPQSSITNAEGDKTTFGYDYWPNINQRQSTPKPSSPLGQITTSATYDCTYMVSCSKPVTKTDGRGAVTSLAYSSTTGQPLTETGPGDLNGIQPVKRFGYTMRKAWVSNGAGGFVQNANSVSLLTEERTCRTSATSGDACTGGSADEVVTTYDYGPDTGAVGNNLLLRGVAVTADGQTRRACYGYDAMGNRIWETKPRAGLAACY